MESALSSKSKKKAAAKQVALRRPFCSPNCFKLKRDKQTLFFSLFFRGFVTVFVMTAKGENYV